MHPREITVDGLSIRRRTFLTALSGSTIAWPLALRAQQKSVPVIGFLHSGSPGPVANLTAAFRDGLAETGYAADHSVEIKYRWAEGEYTRLPDLAAELLTLRPQVIAATGGAAVVSAVKAATSTIPIVFAAGDDPVRQGFVASLDHPAGNLTGATFSTSGLAAKRLELLHELVPAVTTIGMLVNPRNAEIDRQTADAEAAARSMGITLVAVEITGPQDLDHAFAKLVERHVGALLTLADLNYREAFAQVSELASRYRLPTCHPEIEATGFGLMSYGGNRREAYRQAGIYAGKILDGAKPMDLPVIESKRFELVINLKTAKALGLTVPQSILDRADEVFE